jgi:capsid protein
MSPEQGVLPWNDDWYKWEYQGPALLTADAKYNSDVDAQEIRIGVKTRSKSVAERGEDLRDIRNIREREADDLFTRARRLADKHDITMDSALAHLESDSPNPTAVAEEPMPEPTITTTGTE